MRQIAIFLPLLCLLISCTGSSAPPPPDQTMVQIYSELALLAGDQGEAASDSLRASVFDRYGYSQDSYEQALQPLRDDPRLWLPFFQAVSDTIESRTEVRPAP